MENIAGKTPLPTIPRRLGAVLIVLASIAFACLAWQPAYGAEQTYGYAGRVETFTAPMDGTYKLEVWGAAGGRNEAGGGQGGKGGYSSGTVHLAAGQTVYVCVGQEGASSLGTTGEAGGRTYPRSYNGGGSAFALSGAGGGATSITTASRGELYNFDSHRNEVLIVAGGGGGGSWRVTGGAGGGLQGGDLHSTYVTPAIVFKGGTQTEGYAFGRGEDGTGPSLTNGIAGGGGGWYGGVAQNGMSSNVMNGEAGTGGSGYIGGVEDGATIIGTASMPAHDGLSRMTGNSGGGYAKVSHYVLSFDVNGHGEAPASVAVAANAAASPPSAPGEQGYTFGGWYVDAACTSEWDWSSPVSADTVLHAKWTGNEFTVVYDGNGAPSGSTPPEPHWYGTAGNVSSNGFSNPGYAFRGWNRAPDGSGDAFEEGAPLPADYESQAGAVVVLYAQWEYIPAPPTGVGTGRAGVVALPVALALAGACLACRFLRSRSLFSNLS